MSYIVMLDFEQPKEIEINLNLVTNVLNDKQISFSVRSFMNKDRIHTHEISCDSGLLEIFISRDGDSITLDGDWNEILDFLMAFRKSIPKAQSLLFFDQGYNNSMLLQSSTSIHEIISVFG